MKKLFIIITILTRGYLYSQTNLVPNPSFESFTACPNGTASANQIENCDFWINPTSYSPDYFNACDTYTPGYYSNSVPLNLEGFQAARTGNAYAGVITQYGNGPNAREYIQSALTQSLLPGTSYFVSFYVSVGDSSPYSSNNVGAFFSDTPISSSNNNNLPYSPQISNNPISNPLTNKSNWTLVSGVFTATGGEKYITIGNFNDDASTNTFTFSGYTAQQIASNYSYLYIDDVSVTLSNGNFELAQKQTLISVYPNPSANFFNIRFNSNKVKEMCVYNSNGELTLNFNNFNSNEIKIDLSEFPKGPYFLKISYDDSFFFKQLLLNK